MYQIILISIATSLTVTALWHAIPWAVKKTYAKLRRKNNSNMCADPECPICRY